MRYPSIATLRAGVPIALVLVAAACTANAQQTPPPSYSSSSRTGYSANPSAAPTNPAYGAPGAAYAQPPQFAVQSPAAAPYPSTGQPPFAATAAPYGAPSMYPQFATAPAAGAPAVQAAAAQPAFATSFTSDGRPSIQQTAAQVDAGGPMSGQDGFAGGAQDLAEMQRRISTLESAGKIEKYPIIRLSGFFQYDTGLFSQDANNMATLGDMQNGSSFRRARLQGLGYLTEFTRYSVEMEFGNAGAGRPSFQDVWGEQGNLPFVGNFRAGQYRQPITMDSWTNIRHLEFFERSAPFQAFDPFRRVGAMIWRNSDDEMSLFAASMYGTGVTFWNGTNTSYNTLGVDNRFATQIGDNGGISFATRATHLLYYDPLTENRHLVHVGAGYNFSELGGTGTTGSFARTYEARAIPEFFVGDSAAAGLTAGGTPSVVDTGRFLANSYNLYHVELAANWGSAHFQSEFIATGVNQMNGPTVFYDGAYVQGGYFLTGESCGYNKQMGALDYNVKPFADFFGIKEGICGWGAWELAARWSYLNLSATNITPANQAGFATAGPPPQPNPGVLNESTVALNWWWNLYTRVQFNWIHGMLDNNATGSSAFDIYAVRFQTEF